MTVSTTEKQPVHAIDCESHLIAQLAQARIRMDEASAAWDERLKWQQAKAAELFERRQSDLFKADLRALRADPFAMAGVFGRTWHSAAWLNCLWQAVLAGLSSAAGVTWEQIKNVVTATGGDWRADQADIQRGRLVALFIALAPNPEAALMHWVADSLGMSSRNRARKRPTNIESSSASCDRPHRTEPIEMLTDGCETVADDMRFEAALARARHFLAMAPKPDIAREALRATAADEIKIWPDRVANLRQAYEAERERCATANVVMELGSASDIRETRRLRRDRDRAERQVEKLERAIESLRNPKKANARQPWQTAWTSDQKIKQRPESNEIESNEINTKPIESSHFEPIANPSNAFESPQMAACSMHAASEMLETDDTNADSNPSGVDKIGENLQLPGLEVSNRQHRRPDPRVIAKAVRGRSQSGFRKSCPKPAGRSQWTSAR